MSLHHATAKRAAAHGIVIATSPEGYGVALPEGTLTVPATVKAATLLDIVIAAQKAGAVPSFDDGEWTVTKDGWQATSEDGEAALEHLLATLADPDHEAPEEVQVSEVETDEEEEEFIPRSVVPIHYKVLYAEKGHPDHCGDEMALRLNNLLKTKGGLNLDGLEHLAQLNGIDTSRYDRTRNGWQGRLRMTVGNLLRNRVKKDPKSVVFPG